ncbi:ATP-binding cassette domain-containing protein [Bifidobacterium fermentum]|uniref:ATP-binding cassette domain-containing protein n=1 Tax=Bifidobacterium fermentum TaxID=3059035 RepID=A0AB39UBZ6_9BIFI
MNYFSASKASCAICNRHCSNNLKTLFSDVSLSLDSGEIVDLIGPSGAGKSTLLTTLALLNPHGSAEMRLQGTACSSVTPEQWRQQVVYLPQRPTLMEETVLDAIRLPFTFKVFRERDKNTDTPSTKDIRAHLDEIGLQDVELDRSPKALSVGQQARVCLLRSLLIKPKVLLSDEVDAGLDDTSADCVGRMLQTHSQNTGMAVLRVRHRDSDGRAQRVLLMKDGALTEDTHPNRSDWNNNWDGDRNND